MDVYDKTPEELAELLKSDLSSGLSVEEAVKKLQLHGANTLPEPKAPHPLFLFLLQWKNPLILLLTGAAVVSGMLGEWTQTLAILAILFLDCSISFYQEFRAEKTFEALRSLLVPKALVIRGGKVEEIFAKELVPGDLVQLEAGDHVPADGRLVQGVHLSVQEAALTGESTAVHKTEKVLIGASLPLAERKNTLFLGTEVLAGRAKLLVTATGKDTELGKIAHLLEGRGEKETPLQKRLKKLSYKLIFLFGGLTSILFFIGIFQGQSWGAMLLLSVSLAVAAVPEGLPVVVTISLAIGLHRMVKKNALIRRLSSVETLGSANCICVDKTGTLTENKMRAVSLWAGGEISQTDRVLRGDFLEALRIGVLCNHAEILEEGKTRGDPTEIALLLAAERQGLFKEELEKEEPLLEEFPFDSERKRMSMLRGSRLYVKGAPEKILALCTSFWKGGASHPLKEEAKRSIEEAISALSKEGFRLLGLAHGATPREADLCFVGCIALFDPPREEVAEVLKTCRKASLNVVMITGDHRETARTLASKIGWDSTEVLEGSELDLLSEEELKEALSTTSLFARVSAEHKLRLIRTLQEKGQVVAMTGDGVNDAPAIHQADIGIAMGIQGTEVSRQAADMVLLDDRFSTLVHAIEEGRVIYQNLYRFVFYLLSANLSEVFVLFIGVMAQFLTPDGLFHPPLLPVQILWVNLVTDGLPGLALAFDRAEPGVMQRPPRKRQEPLLSLRQMGHLLTVSAVVAAGTLAALWFGYQESIVKGQTMAFTALVLIELFLVWIIRWPLKPWENGKLIGAVAISFFLQTIVLYVPPLELVFETTPLSSDDWQVLVGIGGICMAAFALLKWVWAKQKT